MRSDRRWPVVIIGGGFSGTMAAAQLARRGIASALVERAPVAGLGIAYSTTERAHVLNVRAGSMSAWPDDPLHFARYFEERGGQSSGFAERLLFGTYLRQILEEAKGSGRVTVLEDLAIGLEHRARGWQVRLVSGDRLEARALVLAQGNQPPELPFAREDTSDRVVANPWTEEARAAVADAAARDAHVLILGTGLTMVDMVLSLDVAGHSGRITALSRRGLIPRAHADYAPAPVEGGQVPLGNVRALWHWLRERAARVGWRAAVDSLRPHSHVLWQSLPLDEQRRFLRHARPWWDVHRHRIAPEVADGLRAMIAAGRLEVRAGRVRRIAAAKDGLDVGIARRGATGETTVFVDYLFNCTGPLGSIGRTRDPLLRQALDSGIARPDRLGIGLEVDERSRVVGAERMWALGPLTKGRYWEIVAVPDIRGQAEQVAEDISMELGR